MNDVALHPVLGQGVDGQDELLQATRYSTTTSVTVLGRPGWGLYCFAVTHILPPVQVADSKIGEE